MPPDADLHVLARPEQDIVDALGRLAEAVGAPKVAKPDNGPRPDVGRGALTPESVASTVGALMPEGVVIADKSVTFGRGFSPDQGGAAARLAERDRRRDRRRPAAGHRRGDRSTRAAGDQPASGRLGDVHGAGAMDASPGETGRDDRAAVEPEIPRS